MVKMKRAIATLIVCLKPHVFVILCILLVIVHSIYIAIQKSASNSLRLGAKGHDMTLTMTTIMLIVTFVCTTFFVFIVRFELRHELESLLVLFQCSERGMRFLGVIAFHFGLLAFISFIVSHAVERTTRGTWTASEATNYINQTTPTTTINSLDVDGSSGRIWRACEQSAVANQRIHVDTNRLLVATLESDANAQVNGNDNGKDKDKHQQQQQSFSQTYSICSLHQNGRLQRTIQVQKIAQNQQPDKSAYLINQVAMIDRAHLVILYKIWLTAVGYAFLYLIIENLVMFYADMTLVEFVHCAFLHMVARLTGIDLSDYPAGEMMFNSLVRQRIR